MKYVATRTHFRLSVLFLNILLAVYSSSSVSNNPLAEALSDPYFNWNEWHNSYVQEWPPTPLATEIPHLVSNNSEGFLRNLPAHGILIGGLVFGTVAFFNSRYKDRAALKICYTLCRLGHVALSLSQLDESHLFYSIYRVALVNVIVAATYIPQWLENHSYQADMTYHLADIRNENLSLPLERDFGAIRHIDIFHTHYNILTNILRNFRFPRDLEPFKVFKPDILPDPQFVMPADVISHIDNRKLKVSGDLMIAIDPPGYSALWRVPDREDDSDDEDF